MRSNRGFTLLEVLVVLVLVSLIMTLLMQGVLYTLRLRAQFFIQDQYLQETLLPQSWFRLSSAALVPAQVADGSLAFRGEREGFQGLSLMPLLGTLGVPVSIQWRLARTDGQHILQYQQVDEKDSIVVAAWPETTLAEFAYLDDQGNWNERWPPLAEESVGTTTSPQLPVALRLQVLGKDQSLLWLIRVNGRRNWPVDPFYELPNQP